MEEALAMATAEPALYEVASVHHVAAVSGDGLSAGLT